MSLNKKFQVSQNAIYEKVLLNIKFFKELRSWSEAEAAGITREVLKKVEFSNLEVSVASRTRWFLFVVTTVLAILYHFGNDYYFNASFLLVFKRNYCFGC